MKVHCKFDDLVDPKSLNHHPKNRNKHDKDQIERLSKILIYQGWRYAIKVSKQSGFITSGHGRVMTAIDMDLEKVPVVYQDYDDEAQEYADVQSDNAIAAWAELDLSGINLDIGELGPDFDIDLLGIKNFTLDVAEKGHCDEDEVPEKVDPKTKLGDLYQLGNHRLLCGDSTDIKQIEKLMGGEKADMVFTDPPYGISFKSKNVGGWGQDTSGREIKNDDSTEIARKTWRLISDLNIPVVIWGGNYFTDFLPVNGKWYVWNKLAFDKPNQTFSHCELAWTNLPGHQVEMFSHVWDGAFRAGSKKDELQSRVHPNQKPINLIEKMLIEGAVLDLFGGSGSTLIACEKTNRKCFMMELDPHYCDVIVARWEKYTDKKAELTNG